MNLSIYLKTYHSIYFKKVFYFYNKHYKKSLKQKYIINKNNINIFNKIKKNINKKKFNKNKKFSIYQKKYIKNNKIGNDKQIKFCVFAGRQKNIFILHKYINILLEQNIINQYHIFDMTHNLDDCNFLHQEYIILSKKFLKRIFIHNHFKNKEKLLNKINNIIKKPDWSPFYNVISKKKFYDNSIIIKCDDDILFIDINGFKNAIKDRINDKYSFLIHSNCINNNICAYFHKHLFPKAEKYLQIYPIGGILGPLFENPRIAYFMHDYFTTTCLKDVNMENNLRLFDIEDRYINSRISINFIMIRGEDCKYFKDIVHDDEYMVSSYFPEKFLRPNKIKGNFITSHYSYALQNNIMNNNPYIYKKYLDLVEKYISFYIKNIINQVNNINLIKFDSNLLLKKYIPFLLYDISKKKIFLKALHYNYPNFMKTNSINYYIKHPILNKYLYMNYEENKICLSDTKKTLFQIKYINSNIIHIYLGIYNLTNYNLQDIKNKSYLISILNKPNEKNILIQKVDKSNEKYEKYNDCFYLNFLNNNSYLGIKNNLDANEITLTIQKEKQSFWKLEKYIPSFENKNYILLERFNINNKFYYKDLATQQIHTNFYMGWGNENIMYNLI